MKSSWGRWSLASVVVMLTNCGVAPQQNPFEHRADTERPQAADLSPGAQQPRMIAARVRYDPRHDATWYVFEPLKVQIRVPHQWQEGDVRIEALPPIGDAKQTFGVMFEPPDAQAPHYLAIIRDFDSQQWDQLEEFERTEWVELARINTRIYVYASVKANLLADGSTASERFDELIIDNQDARHAVGVAPTPDNVLGASAVRHK